MRYIQIFFFLSLISFKVAGQDVDEPTHQQEADYMKAVTHYIYNVRARYPREDEQSFVLPKNFFLLRNNGTSASFVLGDAYEKALDSLLTLSPSGKEYITRSCLVASTAHLQGVRSIIKDDRRFHYYCAQLTVLARLHLGAMPTIPQLCEFNDPGKQRAGTFCYLQQLEDPDLFKSTISNTNLGSLGSDLKQNSIPLIKYPSGTIHSLHGFMVNDHDCIYFGQKKGPEPLEKIASRLVERFNGNLSEREIAYRKYDTSTVKALNSLKYKDPMAAAAKICLKTEFYKPNLSSVLKAMRYFKI